MIAMELGLQELLARFDRLDRAVDENVERVADRVIQIDRKMDGLVEQQAEMRGTLEAHIASEETWRREVSERVNMVDIEAKHRVKEVKDEALAAAAAAKLIAEAARDAKHDWGVRWQTIVALVAFIGVVIGAVVGINKLAEPAVAKPAIHHSPAATPSR